MVVKKLKPLKIEQLQHACDSSQFTFKTTNDLPQLTEFIGQNRALNAIGLGIGITCRGFNVFAMGPIGQGKRSIVQALLKQEAKERAKPDDICYVHNFDDAKNPKFLKLKAGLGKNLANDMAFILEVLHTEIPAIFESKAYTERIKEIQEEMRTKQDHGLQELEAEAEGKGISILRTPEGFMLALIKNGQIVSEEEFQALPKEEKKSKELDMQLLQKKLGTYVEHLPLWHKELIEKVRDALKKLVMISVGSIFGDIKKKYLDHPHIQNYLATVEQAILDNPKDFLKKTDQASLLGLEHSDTRLHRYKVNVLVDNSDTAGAPVIYEDNPTCTNLLGRIDHISQFGALITDFTQIRSGALHRANGGYLILDARKLLTEPYAWGALKRALRGGMIHVENINQLMGFTGASSLEPQPVPLAVKVILIGDRFLYYLLCTHDPDFLELFKVAADFDEDIPRSLENNLLFARLLTNLSKTDCLMPLTKDAVAAVIDFSSRLADDRKKLSTHVGKITDLLREASHVANLEKSSCIEKSHVGRAIHNQYERASRLKQRHQDYISRGIILIDTDKSVIGQANGLSVVELGGFMFGHPVRITAQAGAGRAGVIDIEREVKLGGPIHSKGVLILSGFLTGRYVKKDPLSVSLSLVFEQSYGGVEGDSATIAEAAAIISVLSGIPLKQSIAITGSMNQHGEVQAVGGVTEKVKGFFDIVQERGFIGKPGVIIPHANLDNLMLPEEILAAIEKQQFFIYAVKTLDEALEILMDREAGVIRGRTKSFPKNSINGLVQTALARFSGKKRS